jgi:hypothetical protein
MANAPSTPEIITVNSERLQTQIRDLLPSQDGFGSELQASNVILPIIDLTATAEGSSLPSYLQQSLAFGSVTPFSVSNGTTTILNQAGFFRIYGDITGINTATGTNVAQIQITDGASTKILNQLIYLSNADLRQSFYSFDFTVFLRAGDSVEMVSSSVNIVLTGVTRQVATGEGALVNPNGFPL